MSADDRSRWQRISDLFAQALERPRDSRTAFVHQRAAGDEQLEAEVRALLDAHERAAFLEVPAAAYDPELTGADTARHVGRSIGPYIITSELGHGGMGVVYCAEDTRLGRKVALKAIAPALATDERMRDRLRREARAVASLSHPAIATVYALEEANGELFIASEYVPGHTLRYEIASGPASPAELMETARAIAGALAAAHAQGIVHRDLKPENVIRREDGQIKVLDFGLARSIKSAADQLTPTLTATGVLVGTPGYMAPEQLRGDVVDARADIFAFGVVISELATGRHPYGGRDTGAMIAALLEGRTPAPAAPIVPSRLDSIVRRCLRARPNERFSSGVELLAALTSEDEGEPTSHGTPAALWWWQFHQLAVAAFHSGMLIALWLARGWFPRPWGNVIFYTALASATAAVTMRLHLCFASIQRVEMLVTQRDRVQGPLVVLEVILQLLLLATGLYGANVDAPAAPLFLIGAIASFLTLLLIEPATYRGITKT